MSEVQELFGSLVFGDSAMKQYLPKDTYEELKKTIELGKELDINIANIVANAMKDWAVSKGATHFTHWFQPMTGITAEKHDGFISPTVEGKVIMVFSGKELVKGEPDASSFPSGGLRATFEARGYTAWDPTSYAFIKDKCLCIPTAFCSYKGEALDMKTPLLRSMEAINKQALRVLKLFGNENVNFVRTTIGIEQEYFLVDESVFNARKDLMFTGRTLYGAKPPKGQELEDHYFGAIKPRVQAFMKELNVELWKLGILAKTEHNEVAPAQHELAPIFTTTNIAADHNQLTMELMQKIARKHGMVCLLHEKPFAGVNGSGKHNNWSISTNTGVNLLEPGDTPFENAQFLTFLAAVIKAVDEYQDLLRLSVASASNDHRLGANEAPPAVVSMFVGEQLDRVLTAIENDTAYDEKKPARMKIGVDVLPKFRKDVTDRNRTSPFAFTGNKFEFRMLGSSASVSMANVVLNTIVAEELRQFSDKLESASNFKEALHDIIKETIVNHRRIIFNGNGYNDEWIKEAEKRGLYNFKTTPDVLPVMINEKNVKLFTSHGVFTKEEAESRYEISLENYNKIMHIEASTLIDCVNTEVLPGVSKFVKSLVDSAAAKKEFGLPANYELETAKIASAHEEEIYKGIDELINALAKVEVIENNSTASYAYRDTIIPLMERVRKYIDLVEPLTPDVYWGTPKYEAILFSVK